MLKATLFIQRKNGEREADDTIKIYDDKMMHDMVQIVYTTPDLDKGKKIFLPISKAIVYINDVLKSFEYDSDPFEYVQLSTAIHPSVLFHTSELEDRETRYLIQDMMEMAIRQPVYNTKPQ